MRKGCAGPADNFRPADRCAASQWKSLRHGQPLFPHGLCTGYGLCSPVKLRPLLLLACLALPLPKAAPVLTMKVITLRAGMKGCVEDIEDASGSVQSCIRCPAHGRKVCATPYDTGRARCMFNVLGQPGRGSHTPRVSPVHRGFAARSDQRRRFLSQFDLVSGRQISPGEHGYVCSDSPEQRMHPVMEPQKTQDGWWW